MNALSYNACSSFGRELKPETNLAAFSLNIENSMPILANGITITPHSTNPIFIVYTSAYPFRSSSPPLYRKAAGLSIHHQWVP